MKFNFKYMVVVILSSLIVSNFMTAYALPALSFDLENAGNESQINIDNSDNSASVYGLLPEPDISFSPVLDFTLESSDSGITATENTESDSDIEIYGGEVSLFGNSIFEGNGTAADPYLISDAYGLLDFAYVINSSYEDESYLTAYYKLTADIDLDGEEWEPVGTINRSFAGVFDGNNHTVSNMKITKASSPSEYFHLGFFGLIKNGSVKNLTVSDVDINVHEFYENSVASIATDKYTYVNAGGLAARVITEGTGNASIIENCHVNNTTINVSNNFRLFGGGLIGFVHSSGGATIQISGCTAEASCTFAVNDIKEDTQTELGNEARRSRIRVGGFIGYLAVSGALKENNVILEYIPASIAIEKCNSKSNVITSFKDILPYSYNNTQSGGFIGSAALEYSSTLDISESYSSDMVYSYGDNDVYTGAFAGQITTFDGEKSYFESIVNIKNSFSDARVYIQSKMCESYTSGFTAICLVSSVGTKTGINFMNCYSSSNIIADMKVNSKNSQTGTFLAYYNSTKVTATNCYSLKDIIHYRKSVPLLSPVETVLENDADLSLDSYIGFETDIWEISDTADYPYPTLIENTYENGNYSFYEFKNLTAPTLVDEKLEYGTSVSLPNSTPESFYVFSHWSVVPGGAAVSDNDTVNGSAVYFPNFTEQYISFDISFSANGTVFETAPMEYNSTVVFPTAPEKPSDTMFKYEFSHWSLTENGAELTTEEKIVKDKTTFYAVYTSYPNTGWDGVSTADFVNGDGSKDNPYEISDGFQLYNLSKLVNEGIGSYAQAYYVLTKNIDLSGCEWTPIGTSDYPFKGHLDGNGYSIYNYKFTHPETRFIGLFGFIDGAEITKLEIREFTLTLSTEDIVTTDDNRVYIGSIAGFVTSSVLNSVTRISECTVSAVYTINKNSIVSNSAIYAGGISGYIQTDAGYVYIENCISDSSMTIGGINDTLYNTQYVFCGGIVGDMKVTTGYVSGIDKCYFIGKIDITSKASGYAGGIAGFLENYTGNAGGVVSLYGDQDTGDIRNCFVAAESISVSGASNAYAGHIVAYGNSHAKVYNCASSSDTTVSADNLNSDTNVTIQASKTAFIDETYLTEVFGFDFENIWYSVSGKLPKLKAFTLVQSYFKLMKFEIDTDTSKVNISIEARYRDNVDYTILAGVYNERGKMIGFKTVSVTSPTEPQEIDIIITDIPDALTCKLSVISTATFELIEQTKTLS